MSHEAYLGFEARDGHRVGLTIGDLEAANHRADIGEHVAGYLCRCALIRIFGRDRDSSLCAVGLRREEDLRVTVRFEGDRYCFTRRVSHRHFDRLGVEPVCHFDLLTFGEGYGLGVGLGFECPTSVLPSAVALGHRFPVFGFTVPGLEIDTSVHLPVLHAAHDITMVDTVGRRSGAGPVIIGVIGRIRREGIQTRDTVERYVPRSGEDLLIGVGLTPFSERVLDRIFPCLVLVVIELVVEITGLQDLRRVLTFINHGVHRRLEAELDVLGEVILDIHISIPSEVLAIS